MIVEEKIFNTRYDDDDNIICKIELTLEEAKAIVHSLGRTMCKGNELTISMELEDKIWDVIKDY